MNLSPLRRLVSKPRLRWGRRVLWSWQDALGLAVLLAICLHLCHPGFILAQGDAAPILSAANVFAKTAPAWSDFGDYFGRYGPLVSYSPYLATLAVAQALLGPSFAQVFLIFLAFSSGYLGLSLLLRRFGVNDPYVRLACGLFYWLNPFTQQTLITFTTATVFAAVLPWALAIVDELVVHKAVERRYLLIVGFFSCFPLAIVAITPQLLVEFVIITVIFAAVFYRLRGSSYIPLVKYAAFGLAAALWWIIPLGLAYVGARSARSFSVSDNSWIYAHASLLNVLRFSSAWFWYQPIYFPYEPGFDGNVFTYAATMVPVIGLAASLTIRRKRYLVIGRTLAIIAVCCFLVIKGVHPPLASLDRLIFSLPLAFLFQESAGFVVLALICCLMASGLYMCSRRRFTKVAAGIFTLAAIAAGWPLIGGQVYHDYFTGVPSQYAAVPAAYQRASKLVKGYGVLVLPFDDGYQAEYRWGFLGSDVFPETIFSGDVLVPSPPVGYVANERQSQFARYVLHAMRVRPTVVDKLLRSVGIRYVVYRGDIVGRLPDTAMSVDELYRIFGSRSARQFGPLTIFDLGAPVPRAFLADRVMGTEAKFPDVAMEEFARDGIPRVDPSTVGHVAVFAEPFNLTKRASVTLPLDDRGYAGLTPRVIRPSTRQSGQIVMDHVRFIPTLTNPTASGQQHIVVLNAASKAVSATVHVRVALARSPCFELYVDAGAVSEACADRKFGDYANFTYMDVALSPGTHDLIVRPLFSLSGDSVRHHWAASKSTFTRDPFYVEYSAAGSPVKVSTGTRSVSFSSKTTVVAQWETNYNLNTRAAIAIVDKAPGTIFPAAAAYFVAFRINAPKKPPVYCVTNLALGSVIQLKPIVLRCLNPTLYDLGEPGKVVVSQVSVLTGTNVPAVSVLGPIGIAGLVELGPIGSDAGDSISACEKLTVGKRCLAWQQIHYAAGYATAPIRLFADSRHAPRRLFELLVHRAPIRRSMDVGFFTHDAVSDVKVVTYPGGRVKTLPAYVLDGFPHVTVEVPRETSVRIIGASTTRADSFVAVVTEADIHEGSDERDIPVMVAVNHDVRYAPVAHYNAWYAVGKNQFSVDGSLVVHQAFNNTWLCVTARAPFVAPHFVANEWANGWDIAPGERFLAINCIVLLQIVCFVGALLTLIGIAFYNKVMSR